MHACSVMQGAALKGYSAMMRQRDSIAACTAAEPALEKCTVHVCSARTAHAVRSLVQSFRPQPHPRQQATCAKADGVSPPSSCSANRSASVA